MILLRAAGALSLALLVPLGVAGCEQACGEVSYASVVVAVVDASGDPVRDAKVTFRVDDGPEEDAYCAPVSDAGGCDSWIAGEDRTGLFHVHAASADGKLSADALVNVTSSGCDILTERETLVLK